MRIEYATDPELFREVGEAWLAEAKYEEYGFKVTVDGIIADSKEWLASGLGAVIALVHEEKGYVGFMTVYCCEKFLGNDPIAFEKYWYVMPQYRIGAIRMLNEAKKWAKQQGATHIVLSASAMASGMYDKLCELYERLGMQVFEKSYVCRI